MITTENNQFDVQFLLPLNFSQYFTFSFHSGTWLTYPQPLLALGLRMTITQQLQISLKSITAHKFLLLHLDVLMKSKKILLGQEVSPYTVVMLQ